nr:PKD domain-containing protein [Candidatus Sigynarchaeota archaeon]
MRRTTLGSRGTSTGLMTNHRLSTLLFIVAIGIIIISLSTVVSNQQDKDEIPEIDNPALRASGANIQISSFTSDRSVYVAGMTMQLSVTVQNTGDVAATNVMVSVSFGGYSGLPPSASSGPYYIPSGSSSTAMIMTGIFASGGTANVTLTASASGQEAGTGYPVLAPTRSLTVRIQAQASISITGLVASPSGPYVSTMTFFLNVTFTNTGGTAATVDATMDDGTYSGLTWSNPVAVNVNALGTATQLFIVNVLSDAATNASVDIHMTWSGNEAISNRAMTGDIPVDQMLVAIQPRAGVSITSLEISPPGPYLGGQTFSLIVTFSNTGGTAATVDGTCSALSYTYLTFNNPAAVVVNAGEMSMQVFIGSIATDATTNMSVDIHVTWSGTEAISGRAISGDTPVDSILISVGCGSRGITSLAVAPSSPFVAGTSFTLTVTFNNEMGYGATMDAMLDDGTYTGLSWNNPVAMHVSAGGTATQQFTVTIAAGAATNASVDIHVTWSGYEDITMRAINGDTPIDQVLVGVLTPACISVTSIVTTSGNGTYVAGGWFTVNVIYSNTGGMAATVDGMLTFGGYGGIAGQTNPAAVMVVASGTSIQVYNVTISESAMTSAVMVSCDWTATEAISGRSFYGSGGSLQLNIRAHAMLAVSNVIDLTGTQPYAHGESFVLRFVVQNTGDVKINTMNVYMTFGVAVPGSFTTNVSSYNSSLAAGSTQNFDFFINILYGSDGMIDFTGNACGLEEYSGSVLIASRIYALEIGGGCSIVDRIIDLNGVDQHYTRTSLMLLRVRLTNFQSLDFVNGTVTFTFNATGYVTTPASVFITNFLAYTIRNVNFNVSITGNAPYGHVLIDANFAGRTSGGAVMVDNGAGMPLRILNRCPAVLNITSIQYRSGTGTYVQGTTFIVRVNLANTGQLDAIMDSIVVDFNGASGLSATALGTPVMVLARGSAYTELTITLEQAATLGPVTIDATTAGTEEITGNSRSATSGANDLDIVVQSCAPMISIMKLDTRENYSQGEALAILVTISADIYPYTIGNGTLSIEFNRTTGFTANTTYTGITMPARSSTDFYFIVRIAGNAPTGAVTIAAHFTGINNASQPLDIISGPLSIYVQAEENVTVISVTSIVCINGDRPYRANSSFTIQITYHNMDGSRSVAVVDGSVNFGNYNGIASISDPAAVLVHPGCSITQTFTITIRPSAENAYFAIYFNWTAVELLSNRTFSNSSSISLDIQVIALQPPIAAFTFVSSRLQINELVYITDLSHDPDGEVCSWFWNFGDGTNSTMQNATHTYVEPGEYTITLVVHDDDGLTSTFVGKITVVAIMSRQGVVTITSLLGVFLIGGAVIASRLKKKKTKRDWVEA